MTWTAVGSMQGGNDSALSITNSAVGDLLICAVGNWTNSTVWATGLTGGGATWTPAGVHFSGTVNAYSSAVFLGKVTATGAQTATPTWSGTAPAGYGIICQEFHSTVGSWTFDKQGSLDSAGTASWPSLTPGFGAGELYFGYILGNGATVGSTSGYVYDANADTQGNGTAYNLNCGSGATFPVWADTNEQLGVAILVTEGSGAVPVDTVIQAPPPVPGRKPFRKPGGQIIPATQQTSGGILGVCAAAGAGSVTAAATVIVTAAAAGAGSVTAFSGSGAVVPVDTVIQAPPPPPAPKLFRGNSGSRIIPPVQNGVRYITGASADGTHFVDQYGSPRFFVNEDQWYLMTSAGRYSGNYQADITGYMAARSAQGYTAVEVSAYSFNDGSSTQPYGDGRDWDGIWPFNTSNDPTTGLNNTFWARRDYLNATAARYGITVVWTFTGSTGTVSANNPMTYGFTTAQWTAYGAALGARYKNTPNIMWICGDEIPAGFDTGLEAWLTAARAAGDNHLFSIQNGYPTTSRINLPPGTGPPSSLVGPSYAQYNWVYDYQQPYNGVIPAMAEPVADSFPVIPVVWSDGFYIDQGTTGTTSEHLERNNWWWSLSSGACGVGSGDGNVYEMPANFLTYITSGSAPAGNFYTSQVGAIATAFTSLNGWWKLMPDLGTLVTAGRGTYVAAVDTSTYYTSDTDPYITVAWVSDGSLAVIYFPNGGTITVNQAKMAAGYTANWMDPSTGALTSVTAASTYNASTRPANAQGDEDWVLVLQGTPTGPASGTCTAAGAGAATARATQIVTGAAAGAGSVTAAATVIPAIAAAAGAGAATALVTQAASAAAAGAGAVTGIATQAATGASAGAGAASAAAAEIAPGAAAGAGTAAGLATQAVTGTAAGAGSVSDVVTQAVTGSAAGAGSVTATGTVSGLNTGTGAAAGAGSATAVVTQIAPGSAAGAGATTAAVTQAAVSLSAGTGTAAAAATQAAPAAAAGAGATGTDPVTQAVTGAAAGAGSVTAVGSVSGQNTGIAAGAGSVTALATQIAPAAATGAGSAAAVAVQAVTAPAAGAGVASAAATQSAAALAAGSGATGTSPVVQAVTATAAGAGAVTAAGSTGGAATGTAAGAGSATALATQIVTGTAAGAGAALSAPVLSAAGSAAGAGSVTAVGIVLTAGTASAAGAGAVTAVVTQRVTGTAAGAGSVMANAGGTVVSSADTAKATESAFYYIPGTGDTAHGAEGGAVVTVRGADKASAVDVPLSAWPASHDAARAADKAASAWPFGADTGRATEQTLPFHFTGLDAATGLEVLHEMGIWTYVPANVHLLGTFWRITGTDEHGAEVTVLEGERLSGAVLRLAEAVSWSRVTVRVRSADSVSSAEAAGPLVGVTCWVTAAVQVTCWVESR